MPNENTLPTPETRREMFLAAAAGESVEKPEPITREEMFLDAIGSGSIDAYTKAETNELLNNKADLVDGKVPAAQLPSYVDDVVEYASASLFPATGESGKIYLALDSNTSYRWSGSTYIAITGQSDWNQADTSAPDYIKNKPELGTAAAKDMDDTLSGTSTSPVQNNTLYIKFLDIDANIAALRVMMDAVLYGYRVNKNDSNPETRVEYLYDAVGMTPARIDYTSGTFNYGSWASAWFITGNKPVALKYDGTVDYELDPDDYSKKADGTASDVTDNTYAGNFMASIPTVWVKRWEDADYEYTAISNKQITPDFYADAHDNGAGDINDMIYLPMFKGCIVDGKMRSLSGVTPTVSTTGSAEKTAAEACGSGWQLWDWAKHELISDLLTLISRSTDSQAAFGNGYVSGSAVKTTGTSGAGQFWGANDQTHLVKVFHIEDFWGHRWDRCLGINLVDNQYVYKLVVPYLLEPDSSYTYSGLYAPDTDKYQKNQNVGRYGSLPKVTGNGASSTTYVCDYLWKNASGVRVGLCGGYSGLGLYCGSRSLNLRNAASDTSVAVGGSPCFNPHHEGV